MLAFDGPLSASGPGDISKGTAVPWQSDTDSCRAGYPGTPFPQDEFIPTFWPSRVPNNVLTEDCYAVVIDASQPIERRLEAFYTRQLWLRNLSFNAPKFDQLEAMVHRFGEQGVVERREHDAGPEFPPAMYVETLPPTHAKAEGTEAIAAQRPGPHEHSVSEEYARARFPRLRR